VTVREFQLTTGQPTKVTDRLQRTLVSPMPTMPPYHDGNSSNRSLLTSLNGSFMTASSSSTLVNSQASSFRSEPTYAAERTSSYGLSRPLERAFVAPTPTTTVARNASRISTKAAAMPSEKLLKISYHTFGRPKRMVNDMDVILSVIEDEMRRYREDMTVSLPEIEELEREIRSELLEQVNCR
jgi:hypothetical protein